MYFCFENGLIWSGAAMELSVAMPLSWLPLISDYTGETTKPVKATMKDKIGLLFIQCEKQHDRIMLYFDDNMFSESDLIKSFKECCEYHDRRFMTSEEMVTLYP